MTHHVTKLVKVGSLSPAERKARGLEDMPDTMEIPIVVEELVPDPPKVASEPLKVPDGYRRQASASSESSSSAESTSAE